MDTGSFVWHPQSPVTVRLVERQSGSAMQAMLLSTSFPKSPSTAQGIVLCIGAIIFQGRGCPASDTVERMANLFGTSLSLAKLPPAPNEVDRVVRSSHFALNSNGF